MPAGTDSTTDPRPPLTPFFIVWKADLSGPCQSARPPCLVNQHPRDCTEPRYASFIMCCGLYDITVPHGRCHARDVFRQRDNIRGSPSCLTIIPTTVCVIKHGGGRASVRLLTNSGMNRDAGTQTSAPDLASYQTTNLSPCPIEMSEMLNDAGFCRFRRRNHLWYDTFF